MLNVRDKFIQNPIIDFFHLKLKQVIFYLKLFLQINEDPILICKLENKIIVIIIIHLENTGPRKCNGIN